MNHFPYVQLSVQMLAGLLPDQQVLGTLLGTSSSSILDLVDLSQDQCLLGEEIRIGCKLLDVW